LFKNTIAALTCKVLWGPRGTWALTGACFGALRPGLRPVRAAGAAVQSEASSQAAKYIRSAVRAHVAVCVEAVSKTSAFLQFVRALSKRYTHWLCVAYALPAYLYRLGATTIMLGKKSSWLLVSLALGMPMYSQALQAQQAHTS